MGERQGWEANLVLGQTADVVLEPLCYISVETWLVPGVDECNQGNLFQLNEFIHCLSE